MVICRVRLWPRDQSQATTAQNHAWHANAAKQSQILHSFRKDQQAGKGSLAAHIIMSSSSMIFPIDEKVSRIVVMMTLSEPNLATILKERKARSTRSCRTARKHGACAVSAPV